MQGELQKLEERNCQKMAALKNLEEKISTLENGNLLMGNDNCSGAALKAVTQLLTTIFNIFFSTFKMLAIYGNSESFCLL